MIELTNSKHGTSCTIDAHIGDALRSDQVCDVWGKLCGKIFCCDIDSGGITRDSEVWIRTDREGRHILNESPF